ncbi:hypothetical protein [Roseateles sp. MS654]|uniref:hypothetical protein n=1 Tax=Roseateles sp. MS654 TaxID=3412685 RepID=UPI003C2FEEFC
MSPSGMAQTAASDAENSAPAVHPNASRADPNADRRVRRESRLFMRRRSRFADLPYGYGIQRAQALLKENGNPPPEFDIDDKVFLVTVRKRPT